MRGAFEKYFKLTRLLKATRRDLSVPAEKISEMVGRTVTLDAVRKVRQKLGIKKKRGRGICGIRQSPEENN